MCCISQLPKGPWFRREDLALSNIKMGKLFGALLPSPILKEIPILIGILQFDQALHSPHQDVAFLLVFFPLPHPSLMLSTPTTH